MPELWRLTTVSGGQDVLIRIVAASHDDLQRSWIRSPDRTGRDRTGAVTRTRSAIVLQTHFQNRMLPLFGEAGRAAG
jgi:hypothetical protein